MAVLDLIGSSEIFRALLDNIKLVAPTNSVVLLHGETGTGKELVARAIHEASPRYKSRFIAVNCAAIPGTLLESEIFGHERGAFTGALAQTVGRFQAADRGTLFLDEIGDLPLELQPKLLRALQEKQFERLGSNHTLQVDVRVIAATNQDLDRMVEERMFRRDLYYRLNVFPIHLPPLRERRADIPLLVEHFVQKFARQQGKVIALVPIEVMDALKRHDWPGNIRELQNVIERGVIMSRGSVLSSTTTEHLAHTSTPPVRPPAAMEHTAVKTLAEVQREHILNTLEATNWTIGGSHGAAAQLGLPRTTLIARMRRLGMPTKGLRRREELSFAAAANIHQQPATPVDQRSAASTNSETSGSTERFLCGGPR